MKGRPDAERLAASSGRSAAQACAYRLQSTHQPKSGAKLHPLLMPRTPDNDATPRLAELEAYLAVHTDTAYVDGVLPDLCGVMRGKRFPRAELRKLFEHGFTLPYSTLFLEVTGACGDPLGRGFSDGDPDGLAVPVPGTLKPVPWSGDETAQVLVTLRDSAGQPASFEPRNIALRAVDHFTAQGLTPRVAFELEFYLLEASLAEDGQPQALKLPLRGTERRSVGAHETQVYGVAELGRVSEVLHEIYRAGQAQGLPLSAASSEYGPGQFEINLNYCDDAVLAADHCVHLRHLVRSVAERHGLRASFLAKPFMQHSGSGMHVHVSALDNNGVNVFAPPTPAGEPDGKRLASCSEQLRYAVGGTLATLYDAMAIFAPNVNSYRRFGPNLYVPVSRSWTVNNRSGAVRVPSGPLDARRLEHRMASADANPYLVLACVLAGMHSGMERSLDPGPPAQGNSCAQVDPEVPLDWAAALDRLDASRPMRDYLGDDYIDLYCATKRAERARFFDRPSRREMEWYL